MEKINTPQVIKEVATRMGCYRKDAAELLSHFATVIIENVEQGKAVAFKGLGVFYPGLNHGSRGSYKTMMFRPAKIVRTCLTKSHARDS